jgi:hypothetical protein
MIQSVGGVAVRLLPKQPGYLHRVVQRHRFSMQPPRRSNKGAGSRAPEQCHIPEIGYPEQYQFSFPCLLSLFLQFSFIHKYDVSANDRYTTAALNLICFFFHYFLIFRRETG